MSPRHPQELSAQARKGRKKSPWSRGPACDTKAAQESYDRYVARKSKRKPA